MLWLPVVLSAWSVGRSAAAQCDTASTKKSTEAAENVPIEAKALVVRLASQFGDTGSAPVLGAGILVGADASNLYVATARHVIRQDSVNAHTIWTCLATGDSGRATLVTFSPDLDFALLRLPANKTLLARAVPQSWDRRARGSVHSDDAVNPVGCPSGRCWQAPRPADRVMWAGNIEILFQTVFVDEGSSGGALFNRWWEVVGMVTTDDPPRGGAIPIDRVMAPVDSLRIPLQMRRPPFPRGGYRMSLGGSVMLATTGGGGGGRVPSGRLTLTRQASPVISWHLAALRLAPENLAISAGLAGVGVELRQGRFVLRPFVEAGFGRTEGRYDLGGYYVAGPGGSRYVPFWRRVQGAGAGLGGGIGLEAITLSRVIVDVTAGYWTFTTPENSPRLRGAFIGAGLRWGL